MKNALSLCIAMAIILGLFSSCANPPWSKTPANETLPRPADQPSEENTNAEPDPVDLSGLTEEELGRISEAAREVLLTIDKKDKESFFISIVTDKTVSEVDELADEKLSQYTARINELETEIKELSNQLQTSEFSIRSGMATNDLSSLSSRKAELEAELNELIRENSDTYDEIRIDIFTDSNKPVIDAFIKRHDLKPDSAAYISYVTAMIHDIPLTPEQVAEIAKDSDVARITYMPKNDELHFGEDSAEETQSKN